jgi:hypothetical protein
LYLDNLAPRGTSRVQRAARNEQRRRDDPNRGIGTRVSRNDSTGKRTSVSDRPPPSYARAQLASPRAFCAILWHFIASFKLSRVSHLAIGPGMTRATRHRRFSARRPPPTHGILAITRQPRVGEPPKTRRRCRLPPADAPSETKNNRNSRFVSGSLVYNSRKSKVGHLGARDI